MLGYEKIQIFCEDLKDLYAKRLASLHFGSMTDNSLKCWLERVKLKARWWYMKNYRHELMSI